MDNDNAHDEIMSNSRNNSYNLNPKRYYGQPKRLFSS